MTKFKAWRRVEGEYEITIEAESIKEALAMAEKISLKEFMEGEVMVEKTVISGIFDPNEGQ